MNGYISHFSCICIYIGTKQSRSMILLHCYCYRAPHGTNDYDSVNKHNAATETTARKSKELYTPDG